MGGRDPTSVQGQTLLFGFSFLSSHFDISRDGNSYLSLGIERRGAVSYLYLGLDPPLIDLLKKAGDKMRVVVCLITPHLSFKLAIPATMGLINLPSLIDQTLGSFRTSE